MSLDRLSPQVQRIQAGSPYIDIYTDAPSSPLRSRPPQQHAALALPHAHPEPKRWKNPGGWGARHINDKAPFNLWDEQERKYRPLKKGKELQWVRDNFGDGGLGMSGWYMWIETANPPRPVPLTVGCMPVMFIGIGEEHREPIPRTPYSNPRVADPCPDLHWPTMTFPTKEQNIALLTALKPIANVCAIFYMPNWTIVELEHGDGRNYDAKSLPGIVARRTALYHHAEAPFHKSMKNMTRARRVDPAQYPTTNFGPMPQDGQNYLRHSHLSPGCRLECGYGMPGSENEHMNAATSSGVKLRRLDGREVLTVSHHGFLISQEVYHPFADEDKIGDVIDTRSELDIALVELTPAASAKFTNACYFQAETPRMLLEGSQIEEGSWSEVDGMSSGLVSLLTYGLHHMKPRRPAGHPEIEFREWEAYSVDAIFGAVNNAICDGMCGAPIIRCETGGVGGFFHLSDGLNCFSAHLDDLIAEGWQLA